MQSIVLRSVLSLSALMFVGACEDRRAQPQYSYNEPPPPPPTRSCTDGEIQLVQGAMAQSTYDADSCVWFKRDAGASLSACEFERASGLISADGSVTIYDGMTSDTFDQSVSGIFSSTGEVLQLSRTGTSYSYDQACARAGLVVGTVVVGCLMDANCRESSSSR